MLTSDLQRTYEILNTGDSMPACWHSLKEWLAIYAIVPLQIEVDSDGVKQVYAAVLSTPGFEPLACEQNATQAADWMIDERMDKLSMYRGE